MPDDNITPVDKSVREDGEKSKKDILMERLKQARHSICNEHRYLQKFSRFNRQIILQ